MTLNLLLPCFACATLLLTAGLAWAGRPLQAEDAGVIATGGCELEGAHLQGRQAAGDSHLSSLQLACGVGASTQLGLQTFHPAARAFTGKSQLLSLADGAGGIALAWNLAQQRDAGRWRLGQRALNLAASLPLGADLTVHANLGWRRDVIAAQTSTTWALAVEHAGLGAGQRWQPMAEVFGDDRSHPFVNAALRYVLLPDRFSVDGSFGRQIGGQRTRLTTLGFNLAF